MSHDFDVIVVGAGIGGAAFAASLVARRIVSADRVALVADRFATAPTPHLELDLRVFALSRASQRLLQQLGVWQQIPAGRITAYERMCVWDARDSAASASSLRFDCADIGEPDLGHIVEGRALQWLVLDAARKAGVTLIESGVESAAVTDKAAQLQLSDGRLLRGALIVAADGVESKMRALFQIQTQGHSYHQQALVAHVRTARPHESTAWQRFLPSGPLAFLPLGDGRCSLVWSIDGAQGDAMRALSPADFDAALTKASAEVLGACNLTTPLSSFPLQLQYATEYVRPRFALLGDAAHAIHPLAGQGLNLGLRDCTALLDLLGTARDSQFGDLRFLRRYERARKSDNLLAAGAFDGMNQLFSNDSALLAGLRSLGLSAVGRAPFLKRLLARQALGI